MKKIIILAILVTFSLFLNAQTDSRSNNVPNLIGFQGRLSDDIGDAINETINITFSIYDVEAGGSSLWSETQAVDVVEGLFNVTLGNSTPLDEDDFNSASRWIGILVETDSEMIPRTRITAVPYALQAGTAAPDDDWTISGSDIYNDTSYVGIGTNTPTTNLHVFGGTTSKYGEHDNPLCVEGDQYTYLELLGSGNQAGVIYNRDESTGWLTGLNNDGKFRIADMPTMDSSGLAAAKDGSEGITLLSNGNVGIGTIDPTNKLEVNGNVEANGFTIDGVPVGTSSDSYWSESNGNIHYNSGNIGIGTDDPTNMLHIEGNVMDPLLYINKTGPGRGLKVRTTFACALWVEYSGNHGLRVSQAQGDGVYIEDVLGNGIEVVSAGGFAGKFNGDGFFSGKLGLGTDTPVRTLHVNDYMRLEPVSNAPDTPSAGDIYFDLEDSMLKCYDGSVWQDCWASAE